MIFVHRLRKDYSMNYFNSKRFRKKNENARGVFWIMVSRSLDVSLHFNENLTISGFLYIFCIDLNQRESAVSACLGFFFQSISKLLQFGTGFWSFLDVSEHFNKSAHFLIIRNRYNPFKVQIGQNFLNLTRWFLLTFRSDLNLTRWFLLDSGAFLDPVLSVFPLRNRILGVPKSPNFSACGGLKNPNLGRWFLLYFRSDLNLTKVVFL